MIYPSILSTNRNRITQFSPYRQTQEQLEVIKRKGTNFMGRSVSRNQRSDSREGSVDSDYSLEEIASLIETAAGLKNVHFRQ